MLAATLARQSRERQVMG